MIAIGLMSGTSTDGVDAAAIRIDNKGGYYYLGLYSSPFEDDLKARLLKLQAIPAEMQEIDDPLDFMLRARRDLTLAYATAAQELLGNLGLSASDVVVAGAHGQTLRHKPEQGYTYQMFDGALLTCALGIDVVCDFRSKDVALGGQGAPLVPAFHRAWLHAHGVAGSSGVLNLGGFSNLTVLGQDSIRGGDCGPANSLLDAWAWSRFGKAFDVGGEIASYGEVIEELLGLMMRHSFLSQSWPKSTGREHFNLAWLMDLLEQLPYQADERDVMRTLTAFSAQCVASCLPSGLSTVYVCGGGSKNPILMNELAHAMPLTEWRGIEDTGIDGQAVEACAFAWLAHQFLEERSGNCPEVTGARRLGVLGALYPAK